jgi:hypothetical protein
MNAKMSRKQDEDETLNNFRFKKLLLFFVLAQAFFVIHSFIFFFKQSSKFLKLFIMSSV